MMHFARISVNGTIAIGDRSIVQQSFLLTLDIIFWMGAIGILPLVTIRSIAITTMMAPFIRTEIYCPMR